MPALGLFSEVMEGGLDSSRDKIPLLPPLSTDNKSDWERHANFVVADQQEAEHNYSPSKMADVRQLEQNLDNAAVVH